MCQVSKRHIMLPSVRIGLGYCGGNGARGHIARRGIAGSSGSCHSGTPVASAVVRCFRDWLKQCHACSTASHLTSAGSPKTWLYREWLKNSKHASYRRLGLCYDLHDPPQWLHAFPPSHASLSPWPNDCVCSFSPRMGGTVAISVWEKSWPLNSSGWPVALHNA